MSRRVVVTGMGAVTPLGNAVKDTWRALCEGRSGVRPIAIFDASTFPTRIAGEVKNFKPKDAVRGLARHGYFALSATMEAVRDANLDTRREPDRIGLYFGAGDGGFNFSRYASIIAGAINGHETVEPDRFVENCVENMTRESLVEQEPHEVASHLAEHLGIEGFVSNCLTACAASSQAIGEAAWRIRTGAADVMVTGGAHSMIHPLGVAGFNLLTTLSTRNDAPSRASRPFDRDRDGFVLSEGAGVLVLEEAEHAKRRKAPIYAELAGYGTTADAFRLTDPHPKGRGAIQAMRLSLQDARMSTRDIDYINAHGTSTKLNDQIETSAVKEVFDGVARRIPMSSIKSMLGHMIAAAGAVELIASILTIREGLIPPTINLENPDEACDLDYVPNQARRQKVRTVLSNSFGFGGQNVALIVKKFDG